MRIKSTYGTENKNFSCEKFFRIFCIWLHLRVKLFVVTNYYKTNDINEDNQDYGHAR